MMSEIFVLASSQHLDSLTFYMQTILTLRTLSILDITKPLIRMYTSIISKF